MTTQASSQGEGNQRQYYRLPRDYRIEVREVTLPLPKEPLMRTTCRDISRGGVCVESPVHLPVSTRLIVNVHIPFLNKFSRSFFKVYENDAEQYFQAIGEVAWIQPRGMGYSLGINFVNADESLSAALGKLIEDAAGGKHNRA